MIVHADVRVLPIAIVNALPDSILLLDENLNVITANHSFYRTFRVSQGESEGRSIYDLGNGMWDILPVHQILDRTKRGEILSADDCQVRHHFAGIGEKVMILNALKMPQDSEAGGTILLVIGDRSGEILAREAATERFNRIASANVVGCVIGDFEGRFMFANVGSKWSCLPVCAPMPYGQKGKWKGERHSTSPCIEEMNCRSVTDTKGHLGAADNDNSGLISARLS